MKARYFISLLCFILLVSSCTRRTYHFDHLEDNIDLYIKNIDHYSKFGNKLSPYLFYRNSMVERVMLSDSTKLRLGFLDFQLDTNDLKIQRFILYYPKNEDREIYLFSLKGVRNKTASKIELHGLEMMTIYKGKFYTQDKLTSIRFTDQIIVQSNCKGLTKKSRKKLSIQNSKFEILKFKNFSNKKIYQLDFTKTNERLELKNLTIFYPKDKNQSRSVIYQFKQLYGEDLWLNFENDIPD